MTGQDPAARDAVALAVLLKRRELRRRLGWVAAAVVVAVAGAVVCARGIATSSDGTGAESDLGAVGFGVGLLLTIPAGMLAWRSRQLRRLLLRSTFGAVSVASVRLRSGPFVRTVVAVSDEGDPAVFVPVPGRRAHEVVGAGCAGWQGNHGMRIDRWNLIRPVVTESGLVLELPDELISGVGPRTQQAFADIGVTVALRHGRFPRGLAGAWR